MDRPAYTCTNTIVTGGKTKSRHSTNCTSYTMYNDENDYVQPNLHTSSSSDKRKRLLPVLIAITGFFVVCTAPLLYVFGPVEEDMLSVPYIKLPRPEFHRSSSNNSHQTPTTPDHYQAGEFLRDTRVADHCHLPDVPALGMEGFYIKEEYFLEQVHVILSSGETTPKQLHPKIPPADCNFKSSTVEPFEDFPATVNGYIRANKAHTEFINHTILHNRKCPPGQLSPLGMAKLRQHGRYLRDTYSDLFEHGSEIHHSNKWIKVLSGQDASSFHSTLSFLSGFLPRKHVHTVNVEKVTNRLCDMSQTECHCPNIARSAPFLMDSVLNHTQGSDSQIPANKSFSKFLEKFCKRNMSSVDALNQLSPLICDKSLPSTGCRGNRCWNVSRSHIGRLFQVLDKHIEKWMTHIPNLEHSRLYVFPFLNSLLNSIKNVQLATSPRLLVYTSNEEFMLHLLTAMENKLEKFPRSGSRLVFELLSKSQQQKKHYFLRVLFNGRDVTTSIPLCSRRYDERVCPLKYFADYHNLNFKNMFSKSNYEERCS
ncbi:2-phosphoxylose phosphatase 1-like [Mizuhopecten yessoensis]|uniref:2-phosphoxylose phosphatase 1 n=1 Tax=Mizuhopecten yessoensis TaxID=6573 RepID=A0A210PUY0_MIZYE|nr:2-phosphoxylose phosphatase 1-like [Mizuhopecten yessoensis]OWF40297.1 Acid phosphatase-like protein 2 [Mizuhopecten yessoensis]